MRLQRYRIAVAIGELVADRITVALSGAAAVVKELRSCLAQQPAQTSWAAAPLMHVQHGLPPNSGAMKRSSILAFLGTRTVLVLTHAALTLESAIHARIQNTRITTQPARQQMTIQYKGK